MAAVVVWAGGCSGSGGGTAPDASTPAASNLADALTFHASFDNGTDADFGSGDRRIYTAPSYKKQDQAIPGIGSPDIEVAAGQGRFGDALRFKKKNTMALFYRAENNMAYSESNWTETVSFWLSLDPAVDLEPGFCDPIQITDSAYNDAALWVDFTGDNPRQFRLGVFGDLEVWNPENRPNDENPDFENRLVVVDNPPFTGGEWTHVAITHSGLGSSEGGMAKLFLNGMLQGVSEGITEPFGWELSRGAIRLGVNYVGLYDEVAVFKRMLTEGEILVLYELDEGIASLGK